MSRSRGPFPWLLLLIVPALAWLALSDRNEGGDGAIGGVYAPGEGSAVPCAVPLGWEIAQVDPGFGLGAFEARGAVEDAARLWEDALGRTLFPHAGDDPAIRIRFRFDERQMLAMDRARREDAIGRRDADLEGRMEALARSSERLEREMARHNEEVAEWNRQGGAPADAAQALRRAEEALDARRRSLDDQVRELNRQIEERNWQADRLDGDRPVDPVQTGRYSEEVRTRNGRLLSVADREIEVFRFDDRADLVVVLAHELGHALGLEHTSDPAGLMSAVHEGDISELTRSDLAELETRCPELTVGG